MKLLYSYWFKSDFELVRFVCRNKIKKGDIQNIFQSGNELLMFFWSGYKKIIKN